VAAAAKKAVAAYRMESSATAAKIAKMAPSVEFAAGETAKLQAIRRSMASMKARHHQPSFVAGGLIGRRECVKASTASS